MGIVFAGNFLDHDVIMDKKNRIFVVIGNQHPPNAVFAYLKYVPVNHPTPWKLHGSWFRRVLTEYSAEAVRSVTEEYLLMEKDPVFDAIMPKIRRDEIWKVYKPRERFTQIRKKARDYLELLLLEAVDRLRDNCSIPSGAIGVGGSILVGMHNPSVSDINLIIYGCKPTLDIALCEDLGLDRLNPVTLSERVVRHSRRTGLSPDTLLRIQPHFRNLELKGRPLGISFVKTISERYGERVLKQMGQVEVIAEVKGGECYSLTYPSRASVVRVKKIIGKSPSITEEPLRMREEITEILSFDSIFSYALFRGGEVRIKGVLERVSPDGTYLILVGGYGERSYVVPVS